MIPQMEKFDVHLEGNPAYYLLYDGQDTFTKILKEYKPDKVFLVVDKSVAELTKDELFHLIQNYFSCEKIVIESRERNKSFDSLRDLCEKLIRDGVTKDSIVVAHGGGMIGNLAGLAAALIYRGIRFVEAPTTFLAQTDSVLSNKQAVNSSVGKNHFGVYYAPIFIYADVKYLTRDEPFRIKNGIVETIKNALISDKGLVQVLKEVLHGDGIYTDEEIYQLVRLSVISKAHILAKDSSEKQYGMILEYGHTFGHAIEKLSNGKIMHGEAVAVGMIVAGKISLSMSLLSQSEYDEMVQLIRHYGGMNIKIPEEITVDDIICSILTDNKKKAKGICYVLLKGIGEIHNPNGDYLVTLEDTIVRKALEEYKTEVN